MTQPTFKAGQVYRKIVSVSSYTPDSKHDTRHFECGHSRIVPRAGLHPLTGRCDECKKQLTKARRLANATKLGTSSFAKALRALTKFRE